MPSPRRAGTSGRASSKYEVAVTHGQALLTSRTEPELRRYVRAMQMVINELRAGRGPRAAILDRAGLPELHEFLDRHDHDTLATLRRSPAEGPGVGGIAFVMWRSLRSGVRVQIGRAHV